MGSSLTPGIEVAKMICNQAGLTRSHDGKPIKIIIGGIHATVLPLEMLPYANIVWRGELTGEAQALLMERLVEMDAKEREVRRLGSIPSTIRRRPARWEGIDTRKSWLRWGLTTEVGCGMNCPFCSTTNIFGPQLRLVAEEDVLADIAALPSDAGVLGSLGILYDDNFIYRASLECIKRSMLVAKALGERGLLWVSEVTIATLKKAVEVAKRELGIDLLEYYRSHGCVAMFFGIETVGSDYLSKSLSDEEMIYLLRDLAEHGILTVGSFVVGVDPDEDADRPMWILEFAHKADLGALFASVNTPMPGSHNFISAVSNGTLIFRGWEYFTGEYACFRHPRLSPAQLEDGLYTLATTWYSTGNVLRRTIGPLLGFGPDSKIARELGARPFLTNGVGWRSAHRWKAAIATEGRPEIRDKGLPEVVKAHVLRAIEQDPVSPRLFDVRKVQDGISIPF